MRISSLAAAVLLAAATAAEAADITDVVPGHPGVTYERLLKQVVPTLARDKDGNWTALDVANLRGTDGKLETDTDLAFNSVSALAIKDGGRKRLVLLTGDSQADGSFAAILAVYDDTTPVPKLVDAMDVGGDRFVSFSSPATLAIAADSDAVLVNNNHFNSNQNYSIDTVLFLAGGKLRVALSLFTLNDGACGYERRQVPAYAVHPDGRAKYRALAVSVTQTTTRTDETCDAGTTRPRAGSRVYADAYRWDDRKGAFVPQTGVVEKLSAQSWKTATQ
ncbi:MAG TPA: hypothetical protein VNU97_02115 [Rhizomicrobium sp.]|jgi:hypothetical protein|nr:hypothetical protein [Rhizomicrobium sp.]